MGWGDLSSKTYWRQGASQAGTGRNRKSFQIGRGIHKLKGRRNRLSEKCMEQFAL